MSHPDEEYAASAFREPTVPLRMLPSSDIAERGVICSFMLAPVQVAAICNERELSSATFHNPALGTIYGVLQSLVDAPKPPDNVILTQTLADRGILDQVGGAALIAELFTYLPTATNVKYYLDLMEEKALLRAIITTCGEFRERSYVEQDNPELLAELHAEVTALTLKGTREERTFRQILASTPQRWDETRAGLTGAQLYTGFPRLDALCPLRRKHTLVISGREKSGKSALAGAIVLNAAYTHRVPTLVFPLEMPSEEWVDRLLSEHGALSQTGIHAGQLTAEEMERAAVSIRELGNAPIDIFDSFLSLPKIVAKMRQWKAKHPTGGVCVIDYLQLVEQAFIKGRSRENEVAAMSKTLRNLGKELDILLIELSQENEAGDTRESKALQQDCTALWSVLEELDEKGRVRKGCEKDRTIHVKLQRHGPKNKRVRFQFYGDWMRWTEEPETPELL